MAPRRPTQAERRRVITLDLLADWRPYARPLPQPRGEHDWRYYGTITVNGELGALAWRAGGFGVGTAEHVRALGLWDRIKVNAILQGHPSGLAGAPQFTPAQMADTGRFMDPTGKARST